MKKRIGTLVLMLIIGISIFAFVGCGGISGEEVTQEVYDKAMSSFTNMVLTGNIQVDMTRNSTTETPGGKTKGKAIYKMAIQDNVKAYSITDAGIGKYERFMEKIGDKTYLLNKLSTKKWLGVLTDKDLLSIFITASGVDIIGVINVADFSGLPYKDGRYYFSDELLDKASTDAPSGIASKYKECYIAIKDETVIGMGITHSFRSAGGEGEYSVFDYDEEIKFSYSPNITIPEYDKLS